MRGRWFSLTPLIRSFTSACAAVSAACRSRSARASERSSLMLDAISSSFSAIAFSRRSRSAATSFSRCSRAAAASLSRFSRSALASFSASTTFFSASSFFETNRAAAHVTAFGPRRTRRMTASCCCSGVGIDDHLSRLQNLHQPHDVPLDALEAQPLRGGDVRKAAHLGRQRANLGARLEVGGLQVRHLLREGFQLRPRLHMRVAEFGQLTLVAVEPGAVLEDGGPVVFDALLECLDALDQVVTHGRETAPSASLDAPTGSRR
ncbi:unannotated protein [freshwater metagenome]|uniref:Unannotated protein n=1 Tax=freshwater metagenome TaxID=449393 RepID=A0A6J7IA02_9ZZZZ